MAFKMKNETIDKKHQLQQSVAVISVSESI